MSVLEYIYLKDLEALTLEALSSALAETLPTVSLEDIERKPRAKPNWSAFSLVHRQKSKLSSLIVCTRISAATRREVSLLYKGSRNLEIVSNAQKMIWSQLKGGWQSDREFHEGFKTHYRILALILKLSRGVIDLRENERLYTTRGLSRHLRKLEGG